MEESYFLDVINKICSLCYDVNSKHDSSIKPITLNIDNLDSLYSKEEKALDQYLMSLNDTTLNTICALMSFGNDCSIRVLPINLTAKFNKCYLPYWFDMNKKDSKEQTVDYLVAKTPVLAKYLRRAAELLFYSKEKEIKLNHDCGGDLIEVEGERYLFNSWTEDDEYDEQEYELSLKCLRCNTHVTKIVNRRYFKQQI